jgi:hypothetical protein
MAEGKTPSREDLAMKLSLRALLLWVAFAGIVIAALTRPSPLWARILFTLAIAFIAWSLLSIVATRGRQRSYWIGAAIGSVGYLLLMGGLPSLPWIPGSNASTYLGKGLLTQEVLEWAAHGIGHTWDTHDPSTATLFNERTFQPKESVYLTVTPGGGSFGPGTMIPNPNDPFDPYAPMSGSTPPLPAPPTIYNPGLINQFFLSGHSAFLILIGLLCGGIARWRFGRTEESSLQA